MRRLVALALVPAIIVWGLAIYGAWQLLTRP
jgi:hypothetical protein